MIHLDVNSIKRMVSPDNFVRIYLKSNSNCYANECPRIYFPAELPVGENNIPEYVEGFRKKSFLIDPFPEFDHISLEVSKTKNIVTFLFESIYGFESIAKNSRDISVVYEEISPTTQSNVYKTSLLEKVV